MVSKFSFRKQLFFVSDQVIQSSVLRQDAYAIQQREFSFPYDTCVLLYLIYFSEFLRKQNNKAQWVAL